MKRLFVVFIFLSFLLSSAVAQITRLNEEVKTVPLIENKVAFVKEVPIKFGKTKDEAYQMMRVWAKNSYGKDPFISSVRSDIKKYEIVAKSRIELLLPVDSKGVRERFVMRYRINTFVTDEGKCVLEVEDLSLMYQGAKGDEKSKILPRILKAESFITDEVIRIDDDLSEIRLNTRKSTIFFVNQLFKNFEVALGYN